MDNGLIIGLVLLSGFILVLACVFTRAFFRQQMVGSYPYRFREHEIVVLVAKRRVSLLIDGKMVDDRKALNVYLCTLHGEADSEKIVARIDARVGKARINVSAGGTPLQPDHRG